jgi:hypothetical protein
MITDYIVNHQKLFVNMAPDNVYSIDLNLIFLNLRIKIVSASKH